MKLYNANSGKIENIKIISDNGSTILVNKVTMPTLNALGYYEIQYNSHPNRRYYTSEKTTILVNNKYVIDYVPVERPVEQVLDLMIKDLDLVDDEKSNNAILVTELGFTVKATRKHLDNFERGSKRGLLQARDVNGVKHNLTKPEMDKIAQDIETNGLVLYDTYWTKFDEIKALQSVDECILYEATPYEATVDIIDEVTGQPTGGTEVVIRYRNNVKDW